MTAATVPAVRHEPYGADRVPSPDAVRDVWFVNDDFTGVDALIASHVLDDSVAVVSVEFDRLHEFDLATFPGARTHVVYPSTRSPEWVRDTLRAFREARPGHPSHHPYDPAVCPDPLREVAEGHRSKGLGGETLFAARSADQAAPGRRLRDDLFRSLSDLGELPPVPWVVDGTIPGDALIALIGPPGVGKSAVALDIGCRVALGRPWGGRGVAEGRVLYLIGEAPRQLVDRGAAWAKANRTTLAEIGEKVVTLAAAFPLVDGSPAVDELLEIVEEIAPSVIVVDTLARFAVGLEENSATDMGKLVAVLDRIRRVSGAAVIVVHHTTRGASHGRGSTALLGAVDSELLVEADPDADEAEPRRIRVKNTKNKHAPEAAPLTFALETVGESFVLEPVIVTNRREAGVNRACQVILENVREAGEPVTRTDAKRGAGKSTTATEAFNVLLAGKHLAEVPGEGRHKRLVLGPEPFTPTTTGGVAFDSSFGMRFST